MANYDRITFSDKHALEYINPDDLECIGHTVFKDSQVNLKHIIMKTPKETRRLKGFPNRNEKAEEKFIDLIHGYLTKEDLYLTEITCYNPRGRWSLGKLKGELFKKKTNNLF